jgi:hypothetical protein
MVKIRGSYRKHTFDENIKVPDRTLRRTKAKKKLKNTVENQIFINENNNIPEHRAVNFNKLSFEQYFLKKILFE